MTKRIVELTIVIFSIIIGVTGFTTSDVFAMECKASNDSSFEMILDCTDTVDVKKSTMNDMYSDIDKFSTSFEDAKVYNIRAEGSDTFATLEIPLPYVDALKSDVKFSKSSNFLLEFQNGKLSGSKLHISLSEISGYDGTKNGGSLVHFVFEIKQIPCFAWGLTCATAENFEFALDRGLDLMEPKAKEVQLKLKTESNSQSNQKDIQKTTETKQKQTTLQGPPRVDSDKDGIEDSVDKCINEPENYNDYLDGDGCPDEKSNKTKIKSRR